MCLHTEVCLLLACPLTPADKRCINHTCSLPDHCQSLWDLKAVLKHQDFMGQISVFGYQTSYFLVTSFPPVGPLLSLAVCQKYFKDTDVWFNKTMLVFSQCYYAFYCDFFIGALNEKTLQCLAESDNFLQHFFIAAGGNKMLNLSYFLKED